MEMEKNEWLTGIEKQVARLRKLVNDLVALSRLDEGRPMGEEARFSLSEAVCDTALAFSAAAGRAGKSLRVEVEPACSSPATRPPCASSLPSSWTTP